MKYVFYTAILLLTAVIPTRAIFRANQLYIVIQPNGDTLRCFITGDEFHRRAHDSLDYTIIPDTASGWYVYALLENGELKPSPYIPGQTDPRTVTLTPGVDAKFDSPLRTNTYTVSSVRASPSMGNINHLVLFISFSDVTHQLKAKQTDSLFNGRAVHAASVSNYFKHCSYNKTLLRHHLYPASPGAVISSLQDFNPRSYYMPQSKTNPNGYKDGAEGNARKELLINTAITSIAPLVDPGINFDSDGDGYLDNVIFVVSGGPEYKSPLWPHKGELPGGSTINGKTVKTFTFIVETMLDAGVIVHESLHAMGAPDLYRYNNGYPSTEPAGKWDVMCETQYLNPVQTSAQIKSRYLKWQEIDTIDRCGVYTLLPLSSAKENNTAYILQADTPKEFFLFEYRKKGGAFDEKIPDSGLLVTRINMAFNGSAGYDVSQKIYDEVYIYRPKAGGIDKAAYGTGGRDSLTVHGDPLPKLTDGSISTRIRIEHVRMSGDTLRFYFGPRYEKHVHANFSMEALGDRIVQFRDLSSSDGKVTRRVWKFPGGIPKSIEGVREIKVYYRSKKQIKRQATLIVTNEHSQTDSTLRTVTIR